MALAGHRARGGVQQLLLEAMLITQLAERAGQFVACGRELREQVLLLLGVVLAPGEVAEKLQRRVEDSLLGGVQWLRA